MQKSYVSNLTEFQLSSFFHFFFPTFFGNPCIAKIVATQKRFWPVCESFSFEASGNLLKGKLILPLMRANLNIHSEVKQNVKFHLSGQPKIFLPRDIYRNDYLVIH